MNGPCTCLDGVPLQQRLVIKKYVYTLKKQLDDAESLSGVNELIKQVEELLGRIDALEETLLDNKICVACLNPLDNCTCEAPL